MPEKQPITRNTPALTDEQLAELRALLPHVFSEGRIDFDKLRATLGDFVDENPERYTFTWAGKRDAIRLLQTPSRATLIPVPDESVDFDQTQNIFIEGDNLEVLKLLYKPYFGQIKMIYIDPPYNTGNDFVYPDNFADPLDTYLQITGQKDSEGNLLTSNTETSGRYHSAWLSMMYSRLFLARQLLTEDGAIFISIDDHEVHNLRLIMNEIFGEENFLGQLIWKSRQFPDARSVTQISTDHEYILAYSRQSETIFLGIERDETKFSNPDNDPRGKWMSRSILGLATKEKRPNLHYEIVDPKTGNAYTPPENTGWRYSKERMQKLIAEDRIMFPSSPTGRPREKKFRNELLNELISFPSIINDIYTATGTSEIREIFGFDALDFPKPSELARRLIEQSSESDDIILDFFAGSSTFAHAMLDQNRKDGGNRKFILVQLPEPTKEGSPARQNGYATIAEIGKERIRRVIARMKKEREGQLPLDKPEDLGFKVFKLAESNYRQWQGEGDTPETLAKQMQMFADPLVEGWKAEYVICEVALKEGYGLNILIQDLTGLTEARDGQGAGKERIVSRKDAGGDLSGLYSVTDPDKGQSFYICLANQIKLESLKPLGLKKDDLFICRDIALNDEAAANLALQCRLKTI